MREQIPENLKIRNDFSLQVNYFSLFYFYMFINKDIQTKNITDKFSFLLEVQVLVLDYH